MDTSPRTLETDVPAPESHPTQRWWFRSALIVASFIVGFGATRILLYRPARVQVLQEHETYMSAREYVVIDKRGRIRGRMGAGSNGAAGLSLYDTMGTKRAELAVLSDGRAGLDLRDQRGGTRLLMGNAMDGTPCLALSDQAGVRRLSLGVTSDGVAGMDFNDRRQQFRAGMGTLADGSPILVTIDAQGQQHAAP